MRIVVRIGGSVVANPINTELMGKYADIIKAVKLRGHEVAVIVGGGALARQFIGFAKELNLDMAAQDEIAISCSRLFAQLFLKKLGDVACSKVAITLDDAADSQLIGIGFLSLHAPAIILEIRHGTLPAVLVFGRFGQGFYQFLLEFGGNMG